MHEIAESTMFVSVQIRPCNRESQAARTRECPSEPSSPGAFAQELVCGMDVATRSLLEQKEPCRCR